MKRRLVASVIAVGLVAACAGTNATGTNSTGTGTEATGRVTATTAPAAPSTTSTPAPAPAPRIAAVGVGPAGVPAAVGPTVGPIDSSAYVSCRSKNGLGLLGTPIAPGEFYSDRPTFLQGAAGPDAPLLVMFHGQFGCVENLQSRTQLDELAAVGQVNVLWLSGMPLPGRSWNVNGRCCEPASDHRVDDVAYTEAAIAAALSTGLTPAVIVAVGVSNGAAMALAAACAMPERFAGAVTIGGWVPGPCAADALSLLVVGGSADDVVGGETPATISGYWRTSVVECPQEPVVVAAELVTTTTWQGCTGGAVVRHVRLVGVGHVWPKFTVYDGDLDILRFAAGEF